MVLCVAEQPLHSRPSDAEPGLHLLAELETHLSLAAPNANFLGLRPRDGNARQRRGWSAGRQKCVVVLQGEVGAGDCAGRIDRTSPCEAATGRVAGPSTPLHTPRPLPFLLNFHPLDSCQCLGTSISSPHSPASHSLPECRCSCSPTQRVIFLFITSENQQPRDKVTTPVRPALPRPSLHRRSL